MKKTKENIQEGSHKASPEYYITIKERGPYLVFGQPPLTQQFIELNANGECWSFRQGERFSTEKEPTPLCRCGASKKKPYCDGSHVAAAWNPELKVPEEGLLEGADYYDGPTLVLSDNEDYCVFARFCDAEGGVWNLVGESDGQHERDMTVREANLCPGGRLSAWDKKTKKPFEPKYDPSLALIEDPSIMVSGGLWVRGGIPVRREGGHTYEIRNRTVLCRCGASANKPFCDGTHASMHFDDELLNEVYSTNEM